jgi:hypothetical protein
MSSRHIESDGEIGRDRILHYLEKELIGPEGGPKEVLENEKPQMRYTMGVLFPRSTSAEDLEEDLSAEESSEGPEPAPPKEDRTDDPVNLSNQWMPSSIGLSFYFEGSKSFDMEVWGATYESGDEVYTRKPIAEKSAPITASLSNPNGRSTCEQPVLDGRAKVHSHWRPLGEGFLVTVTLVNSSERSEDERYPDTSDCLYQVGFRCSVPEGNICEYPDIDRAFAGKEERELELMYRRHKTFAVGHGCAASWKDSTETDHIRTELLPRSVVPDLTHKLSPEYALEHSDSEKESDRVFDLSFLASPETERNELCSNLELFLNQYEDWIEEVEIGRDNIPDYLKPAHQRITQRLRKVLQRMRGGIERLRSDEISREAFRLANLAMLMQMHHGKDQLGGERSMRGEVNTLPQSYDYLKLEQYAWRPFQLAFQLITLEGLADYNSEEREIVDLIWFPTGGGKTEAYLAVAAFEILRRRMVHREAGAGTAVITRYTLRLLTSQQFQRSARLICALELLRRENPAVLGDTPVSIGFWAGRSTSPNTYQEAVEKRREMIEVGASSPFQLELCPWCGTELVPGNPSDAESDYGFRADNASFEMFCPTEECRFHNHLPVSVVDEDLYQSPPTFLIGTVDKFARLAWIEGPGAFFGAGDNLPPTLVIQDELHLLSGPLGTTAAVYEAALHELMQVDGNWPKVIASTATIRSAEEQVESLFNREVQVFPPPGPDESDSFFARVDKEAPGRLYVGVLSPHHKPSTSLIRTSAGLLQAPEEVGLSPIEDDIYRSLVVYHLSLRDLGKTAAFAKDDIPARLKVVAPNEERREIDNHGVVELTSNTPSHNIPNVLERLELSPDDDDFVHFLVCTNMISVGVDVDRLSLMAMHGQPKTTSEYIQASSRVGREYPGLVVSHYSANKPRDRSHYEDFTAYHDSLYRHVEPTSVTPYSAPSRDRSLHAALVILVRHKCGLSRDRDAGEFTTDDPCIRSVVQSLIDTVGNVNSDEVEDAKRQLRRLSEEWGRLAEVHGDTLRYDARAGNQFQSLLRPFGKHTDRDGWATLNSMRTVDGESPIMIHGEESN